MRRNRFETTALVSQEKIAHEEMTMSSKETETKFVILKPIEDERIFLLVEKRSGEWTWNSTIDRQIIQDTYYDTPNYELKTKRFGLRIRVPGSGTLVTLKGPPILGTSGALERDEFESFPDDGFFSFLVKKIVSLGLNLSEKPKLGADPHDFLTSLGLIPIQKRMTVRLIRRLYPPNGINPMVELALDTVRYEIGNFEVTHREIEVELMKGCSAHDYEKLILSLKEAFLPMSRIWGVDKLALGFWLKEYYGKGLLSGFVDKEGRLIDKVYDVIEKELSGASDPRVSGLSSKASA